MFASISNIQFLVKYFLLKKKLGMMQQGNANLKPPKDKYNIVYLILLLHGIGMLLPWNMFTTARSYFVDHKLSSNYTGEDSYYATYFLQYVGFASQIPLIICNWINVFINIIVFFIVSSGSETPRVVFSILAEIIMFIITIILALTDSSKWPGAFFWSTMITIVVLNMANGMYENTVFGMAARLPSKYPGGVILGCNISGVLVSVIDFIIVLASTSFKTAATSYFSIALFIMILCLVSYLTLPSIEFYRYYDLLSKKSTNRTNGNKKIPYWKIFKKAFTQLCNVFFVFFFTLAVFPSILADVKKSDPHFIIPDKYYEIIMCFLTFNAASMLGCICSNLVNWPSPKQLIIYVLLRGLFIPFFFFCNYKPLNKVRKVPVLIPNDWIYWVGGISLGFTAGYFSFKAIMYTTESVETSFSSVSGMFGAAVLVTAIFFGVIFSMIFPWLTEV